MSDNRSDSRQVDGEDEINLLNGIAQASITAHWEEFTSNRHGKVGQILPDNPWAADKSASEEKNSIPTHRARKSYEEAREECIKAVEKIAQECIRCNFRYRDLHFDIEMDLKQNHGRDCLFGLWLAKDYQRLGLPVPASYKSLSKPRAVKRVHEIFENPQFYIEGPTSVDIRQGASEDCWFLAALGSLGNKEGLIERICVARNEAVGVYGFVFHRDGEWIHTVIDDKLYLTTPDWDEGKHEMKEWSRVSFRNDLEEEYRKAFQVGSKALCFASCTTDDETWLPLLEKAYAKVHGDYKSIDGGYVGEAMEDLTGGVTTEILTADILDPDAFWKNNLLKVNEEFLFGCATGRFDNWQGGSSNTDRRGIQPAHAYSIMEAREIHLPGDIHGHRLLKIRNPWGKTEWTGAWSDGSPEWTEDLQKLLNHQPGEDGVFWMNYKDWLKKFHFIDQTRLFDDSWKITQQWTPLEIPWSWSARYHTTRFSFTLAKPGPVVVVLSQLDERYWLDFQGQYVFTLNFTISRAGEDEFLYRSHGNYFMKRSVSTEMNLDRGTYVVRMKISATRHHTKATINDVLSTHIDKRQEKLIQVAMSYDLAHAKGMTSSARKNGIGNQSIKEAIVAKTQDIVHAEESGRMRCHGMQDGPRSKRMRPNHWNSHSLRSRSEMQGLQQEHFGSEEIIEETRYGNPNGVGITQDRINVFHRKQAFKYRRPPFRHSAYQDSVQSLLQDHGPDSEHVLPSPSFVPNSAYTLTSPGFGDKQDGDPWADESDRNTSHARPRPIHPYATPWNAVCVVGLRVYTQNGEAPIKIHKPGDKQAADKQNDSASDDDADDTDGQTPSPHTPLDPDDPNRGFVQEPIVPVNLGGDDAEMDEGSDDDDED